MASGPMTFRFLNLRHTEERSIYITQGEFSHEDIEDISKTHLSIKFKKALDEIKNNRYIIRVA